MYFKVSPFTFIFFLRALAIFDDFNFLIASLTLLNISLDSTQNIFLEDLHPFFDAILATVSGLFFAQLRKFLVPVNNPPIGPPFNPPFLHPPDIALRFPPNEQASLWALFR